MKRAIMLSALLTLLGVTATTYATSTYSIDITADTQIYEKRPTFNYSSHTTFVVGSFLDGGVNFDVQGLFLFDVASIPTNQTVTDAYIQLHIQARTSNAGALQMELLRIGQPWDQTTVTYSDRLTLPQGNDLISHLSYSTDSGVTWQNMPTNNLPAEPVSYEVRIHFNTVGLSTIDSWIADESANNGVLLRSPYDTSVINNARFNALESGSNYPLLHLISEDIPGAPIPEPVSIVLLGAAMVCRYFRNQVNQK